MTGMGASHTELTNWAAV